MPEKFLKSFGDESSELQRQNGCMRGILQMFDRQSLSSGGTLTDERAIGAERSRCSLHIVPGKNSNKSLTEKTRTWIESSFSSLDCNNSTQEKQPSIDQKESQAGLANEPIQAECRSLDAQDAMKDSIYEESRSPTLRTSLRDETKLNLVRGSHIARVGGKSRIKYLTDTLGLRIKPKESPQSFSAAYGQQRKSFEAKDTLLYRISNESAHLAFEERHSLPSLDEKEGVKLSLNLRELPRLSLDSRERTLRSSKFDIKPNTNLMDFDSGSINRRADMNLVHRQGVGGNNRLPSAVAKLMGLEAMPKSSQEQKVIGTDINKKMYTVEKKDIGFISTRSAASRGNKEDPTAPQLKKTDSIIKPISHLKVPIEPAPWRNPDKIHARRKIKLGSQEVQMKHRRESGCYDTKTKSKHVEFEQSIEDLRALKHILDVMHVKGISKTKKDEDKPAETSVQVIPSGNSQKIGLFNNQDTPPSLIKKSPRSFNSQIVIMKPAKHINRSDISTSSVVPLEDLSDLKGIKMNRKKTPISTKMDKDQTTKDRTKCTLEENDSHTSHPKMPQLVCRLSKSPREDHENSVKASTSVSPRLRQRKLEIENRSYPPVSSSIRNSSESVSPRCSPRRKPAHAEQNDEKPNDISRGARSQKHQVDKTCFRTDTCISLASQIDLEVRSPNCSQSSSGRASKIASSVSNQKKKKSHSAKEDILTMDLKIAISKQPTPISNIDDSLYGDDLPSMRISSDSLEDDKIEDSLSLTACNPLLKSSSLFHHPKKLTHINHLIQKLSSLSSGDATPPASDRVVADHQYVSEILQASGLLMRDLTLRQINTMANQLHPSGHLINPDLFLVLEQTKSGYLAEPETINKSSNQFKSDTEKLHRKLVFDVVNELLLHKLELAVLLHVCPKPLVQGMKGRFPSRHQLLKALCFDIDHLKAESLSERDDNLTSSEDLFQLMEHKTDSCRESQATIIEIEMLIFKDLVDEVVNEEDT